MRKKVAKAALSSAALVFSVSSCGGGSVRTAPRGPAVIAADGLTPRAVQRAIESARNGQSARYVTVTTANAHYVFSPHHLITKTKRGLLVEAYSKLYVYPLYGTTVSYSGFPNPVAIADIPTVSVDALDARIAAVEAGAARRHDPNEVCSDCIAVLTGRRVSPRNHWAGLRDPWQVHPDYAEPQTWAERSSADLPEATKTPEDDLPYIGGTSTRVSYGWGDYGYWWYSYDYQGTPTGFGAYTGPAVAPAPCTPPGLPIDLASIFSTDPALQAVAQAVAAKNDGKPPTVVVISPAPSSVNGIGMQALQNLNQINLFPDNYKAYIDVGMSLTDMYRHEQLHFWYERRGSDGSRPNPLPNDPSFVANPSVQLTSGIGGTFTVTFNLLNSSGSLDAVQYMAYEHMLIHDDMVASGGVDNAWTGLVDSMQNAASVTTPDGSTAKMSGGQATQAVHDFQLMFSAATGRGGKRPPTVPNANGGCRTAHSTMRTLSATRTTRNVVNGIDYYTLDGYDLMWDGIPAPQ